MSQSVAGRQKKKFENFPQNPLTWHGSCSLKTHLNLLKKICPNFALIVHFIVFCKGCAKPKYARLLSDERSKVVAMPCMDMTERVRNQRAQPS